MIITIPWAPTANTIWRSAKGITYRSARYNKFLKSVSLIIKAYMDEKDVEPFTKKTDRIDVFIILFPPDRRKFDIDNRIKPVLDAITHSGLWLDDGMVDSISVARGKPTPNGAVVIQIYPATTAVVLPGPFGLEEIPPKETTKTKSKKKK